MKTDNRFTWFTNLATSTDRKREYFIDDDVRKNKVTDVIYVILVE